MAAHAEKLDGPARTLMLRLRSLFGPKRDFALVVAEDESLLPSSLGSRLKTPRTRILIALLILVSLTAATATFLIVPRGVSVGKINIQASFPNTTELDLIAHIPIFNPNYLQATIEGDLTVLYYNAEVGLKTIEVHSVPARSLPLVIKVAIKARNLATPYDMTAFSQCTYPPWQLVYFLRATLQVEYMGQHQILPLIDTYTFVSCTFAPDTGDGVTSDALAPVFRNASSAGQDLQTLI